MSHRSQQPLHSSGPAEIEAVTEGAHPSDSLLSESYGFAGPNAGFDLYSPERLASYIPHNSELAQDGFLELVQRGDIGGLADLVGQLGSGGAIVHLLFFGVLILALGLAHSEPDR